MTMPQMNLLSPKIIKELLKKHGAAPLKIMGQNFLINPGILQKIIKAANLDKETTVLEIGPGLGALTLELAERAKKVITIEKDKKMVEILKKILVDKNVKNVQVVKDDILKINISDVIPAKAGIQINGSGSRVKPGMTKMRYKLVANLPYYITSPVIRKFLETENPPKEIILMVQKEVAQRICAMPPDMSLLSVSVQFYASPKIISYVPRGNFWPSPKVDSAILRIIPHSDSKLRIAPEWIYSKHSDIHRLTDSEHSDRFSAFRASFFKTVHAGFSSPRKQLTGNLAKGLKIERHMVEEALKKSGVEPSRRAETLSAEEWKKLTKEIKFPPLVKRE